MLSKPFVHRDHSDGGSKTNDERMTGKSYGTLLKWFAHVGALLSILVGVAVIAGWLLDIEQLKSVAPGFATMKMNAACGFVAAGAALWIRQTNQPGTQLYRLANWLALFVAALGGLTFAEDLFGLQFGIDQFIVREVPIAFDAASPGRMSPASSFTFLVTGAALYSLKARSARVAVWAHWLVVPPLLTSTLAIMGYAYGVQSLYHMSAYASMALHTAIVFLVLALSILASDSKHGFALIASSNTAGGAMSRWLLPLIPAMLFFLGWIRLRGEQIGLYEFHFGLALMVLMSITVCMIAVVWTANNLHKSDVSREVAEAEIINLNAALALRKSQEQFRALVSGVKDYAIFMLDANGLIASWNEGAERIKGYRAEEIIGKHFSCFYTAEDNASGKPAAELLQVVKDGKFEEEGWRLRKDKSRFWANVLITPLRDDNGDLWGFSKITRDITERKNAETLLAEKMQELSRSNEELGQFASVASHDLQEPLRMVCSYMTLLSQRYKGKLDADADEFIAFAVDGAGRMQTLVKDLLAYSQVGTTGLTLRNTSSEKSLQQALVNLRGIIETSGALVTHDPLPAVMADEMQLSQLFQNLVGNAIKYQNSGIPKVHVSAVMNREKKWNFSVQDNGIGIDSKNFDRIFGMFQRLNTREKFEGTGIGLAICKKIVERHGGNISVESQPGQGSTFHFALAEGTTNSFGSVVSQG